MKTEAQRIVSELKALESRHNKAGMQRFGINTSRALGISMKTLREKAKAYRRNHEMALQLWDEGIHEARLLAVLVDDPNQLTEKQMEAWVKDIDSWDLCDQACMNLFDKFPGAWEKARQWSAREEEFVKRAGFVLMAVLSVHDKKAPNDAFLAFLSLIEKESGDDRNFVKKAVNWALRAIGKRNALLNQKALEYSQKLAGSENKAARWIGKDALRELQSEKVQTRLQK
jgi:3-methyladenine DNA glycosylase AlkD